MLPISRMSSFDLEMFAFFFVYVGFCLKMFENVPQWHPSVQSKLEIIMIKKFFVFNDFDVHLLPFIKLPCMYISEKLEKEIISQQG